MKKHILILFHENANRLSISASGAGILASLWRKMGYKVSYQFGVGRYVHADLIFVHIDLSVVPEEYLAYAERYPVAINRNISDIRKSTISSNLVDPAHPWDGPVIVKTNLNYAGRPEYLLESSDGLFSNVVTRKLSSFCSKSSSRYGLPESGVSQIYQVFEHYELVPEETRMNPALVVERFLPETENGMYTIRMYRFLGDKGRCRTYTSKHPVVNSGSSVQDADISPHPVVNLWKEQLNIDYGKFDYVIHRGNPVLLDVNKTPGSKRDLIPPGLQQTFWPQSKRIRRHQILAEGISGFFS